TTQSSWFARSWLVDWTGLGEKRLFNQRDFVADVFRLQVVFKLSGYPNVRVDTVVKRSRGSIDITFRITEGVPTRLTSLRITGLDSVENAFRIRQDLPIAEGDVASDYKLDEAADTITYRLRNHGYPTATVDDDSTAGGPTSNALLIVHTGPHAVFGPIRVTAPPDVDTSHVSALVTARPGNEYRLNEILQSQRSLFTSDLYRMAAVTIDSSRYAVTDTVVPLAVTVAPNFAHRVRASVGYGTDDCFRLGTGWTARNFPSSGLVFDVTGQLSKIGVGSPLGFGLQHNLCSALLNDSIGSRVANYGLNGSLRRGAFLSPSNALTLSAFATRHGEFEVYLRREVGVSVSITRQTAANVPITLAYRIADGTTTADPASFCAFFNTCNTRDIAQLQQRRLQATLSLSILDQHINNPLDPTRGSVLSASAVVSSRFLGSSSTQQFTRLVGDASGYLPILRGVVLAGRVHAGTIFAPRIALSDSTAGNFVPPDQRFYAGGAYDVRGYDQNEMGPLVYVVPSDSIQPDNTFNQSAVRVSPIGGTHTGIANLELRLPTPLFAGRLRFALFVDAGALWTDGGAAPVRITPGAGLRYTSPLGPIRLDVGYNPYQLQAGALYSISNDGSLTLLQNNFLKARTRNWTLHFSIGQAF
ncbi:MAG: autotransporter assembly complex protein TamA, partial [Gemmatimonadales bacterium]